MIGQALTGKGGETFKIIREIGRGGFGVVYLAEDKNKRSHAAKIIAPVHACATAKERERECSRSS